jgi:hypothetical protein
MRDSYAHGRMGKKLFLHELRFYLKFAARFSPLCKEGERFRTHSQSA